MSQAIEDMKQLIAKTESEMMNITAVPKELLKDIGNQNTSSSIAIKLLMEGHSSEDIFVMVKAKYELTSKLF